MAYETDTKGTQAPRRLDDGRLADDFPREDPAHECDVSYTGRDYTCVICGANYGGDTPPSACGDSAHAAQEDSTMTDETTGGDCTRAGGCDVDPCPVCGCSTRSGRTCEMHREDEPDAEPTKFYVNEYLVDLSYGGPEEGGWYYEVGEFVAPHGSAETEDQAISLADSVRPSIAAKNEGRPDITSVLSRGRYTLRIQDHRGADYPQVRPHYE